MKNCIITGGNSGIGFAAAKQIAEKGYAIVLICRNEQRAKKACKDIIEMTGNTAVSYIIADLSNMRAVRKAATDYLSTYDTLDVLINNAADFDLSVKKPVLTADGMERQFATNVAAPFLLTRLLFGAIKQSGNGKVINISSQGLCVYPFIKLNFEHLNGEHSYSPSKTYYQNKLALLMWSLYMADKQKKVKIHAVRVTNVKIDISRYNNLHPLLKKMYAIKSKFSISTEEMAKVYTALATTDEYAGFLYDEKMKEVRANKSAYDKTAQKRLYNLLCDKSDIHYK